MATITPVPTDALRVGDVIAIQRPNGEVLEMTVWAVDAPMSYGRARSAGQSVCAWLGPGRYGVVIDSHLSPGYLGRIS